MNKARLEAFSDGVLAIILTIMVLDLRVPRDGSLQALAPVAPVLASYSVSFVYIGIYWNNHHHLLRAAGRIDGLVMWANLHLLFWLSLVPFVTAWVGNHLGAPAPTALYGAVLLLAALAWLILQQRIIARDGPNSDLARAVGRDRKGHLTRALYAVAIALSFVSPWSAFALYALVALLWVVPDRRIERRIARREGAAHSLSKREPEGARR
jgi:uncharacterized membrane protein